MQTLIITFFNVQLSPFSNDRGTQTYEREFISLENFIAEYGQQYNEAYGPDGWSVEVKK